MNANPAEPCRAAAFALPVAVVALASYHALPTLLAAWGSDLYSRGAQLGFALWLVLLGLVVFRKPPPRNLPPCGCLWRLAFVWLERWAGCAFCITLRWQPRWLRSSGPLPEGFSV